MVKIGLYRQLYTPDYGDRDYRVIRHLGIRLLCWYWSIPLWELERRPEWWADWWKE